jgi:stage II sporulation protein D
MMRMRSGFALIVFLAAHIAWGQANVRIGVLGLFHPHELELAPADNEALRISGANAPLILNGESAPRRILLRASGDRVSIRGMTASSLTITSGDRTSVRFELSVPGKLRRIYEGCLAITASHNELIAVISMDRERAVATIVASEMPRNAPLEALKAQAVASRSFLAGGPRHQEFDFCDSTHCQYLRSPKEVAPSIRAAVEATRGLVLFWENRPIAALYSSRCGGQTRTLQQAGMESANSYPYYSVPCRWCRTHPVQWETRHPPGTPLPDPGNEPSRIFHARLWGWSALPGTSYTAHEDSDGVVVRGSGRGHSLGLCQFGAMGMASEGADFRSILAHYYPNSALRQAP